MDTHLILRNDNLRIIPKMLLYEGLENTHERVCEAITFSPSSHHLSQQALSSSLLLHWQLPSL
jgi:hypothetical protein